MSALSALANPTTQYRATSPGYSSDARRLQEQQAKTFVALHQVRPPPPPFDSLDRTVGAELLDKWNEPCEGAFEFLAAKYPASLLQLIAEGRLEAADLTFAAEIAGRIGDSTEVAKILRPLLAHSAAVVREGAIYGLALHLDDSLRSQLDAISREDPSNAVRIAAANALDEG